MVGPIISGPLSLHSSWRNFWWLNVALHGIIFIALLFLFPETKWHRLHPKELLDQERNALSEKVTAGQNLESKDPERSMTGTTQGAALATQEAVLADLSTSKTAERDPYLGRGKPNKQQFRLYRANIHPFKSIALDLFIPWKLHLFSIVEFSAFVVSWSASSFLTINLTQSQELRRAVIQLLESDDRIHELRHLDWGFHRPRN